MRTFPCTTLLRNLEEISASEFGLTLEEYRELLELQDCGTTVTVTGEATDGYYDICDERGKLLCAAISWYHLDGFTEPV